MKILTLNRCYLPGYKAGGPIRSIANMVERIGNEFQFKIVTADRDSKDDVAYQGITIDGWNRVGKAEVFYMPPKRQSLRGFKNIFCSIEYDIIYLNSFFSPHFTIKPLLLRKMRIIPDRPLIIAPRGEFSPGALGLKGLKKRVYILFAKALGLYRGVVWQASSEYEEADIRRWFGYDARIVIVPNLPTLVHVTDESAIRHNKGKGRLKIIFLSSISRMKNLYGALEMLRNIKDNIEFNIYGPMKDKAYFAKCQKVMKLLPKNVKAKYCGSMPHDHLNAVMKEHDLLFLPTLGENFGHVILEALCAGCLVLISDQTRWRGLEEKNIGWDLPLIRPELFQEVLQKCIDMKSEEYSKWSENAWKYGLNVSQNDSIVELNRQLFRDLIKK